MTQKNSLSFSKMLAEWQVALANWDISCFWRQQLLHAEHQVGSMSFNLPGE